MMPYFSIGLIATVLFFIFFIFVFPLIGVFEKLIYELYSYRSSNEENKSSSTGTRSFSYSFSYNIYKNRKV